MKAGTNSINLNLLLTQKIKKCIWCRFGTVLCVQKYNHRSKLPGLCWGHGLGHAWQFGSLILRVIKILKLELLQCYNEMNSNYLLAFTRVITHDRMRQSYAQSHSVLQRFIADTINTETGTTGSGTVDFFIIISLSTLQNLISFKHGPGE